MFNILFISSDNNYFIRNTPSFYRMYKNLTFFHEQRNYNVIVLQPTRGRNHEEIALRKNIKCYYFKEIRIFRNTFIHFTDVNPFFIVQIIKILKIHKIHLIHVDFPYGINIIRKLTNIPISYNAHNIEAYFWKHIVKLYHKMPIFLRSLYAKYIYLVEKFAVKSASIINAISFYDQKLFNKTYKIYGNKIFVNRIGLNEEIFNNPISQKNARLKLNIRKNQFVVIFHGSYYNNLPNREAIKIIKEKIAPQVNDEEILFLIAGNTPFFKNNKNLRFLGFVHELRNFLYAADIAIVPIFKGSGIKIKVLDYLSSKIPVILTKQAAKRFFLKNGIHGYIVSDENPIEEIIESILKLKKNSKQIIEFKNNIQKLLEKKFNWETILLALEKRYREIITRNIN